VPKHAKNAPHWGAYTAPHTPSWIQGGLLRGREGQGGEGRGRERERKGVAEGRVKRVKWRERGIPALHFPHF